MKIWLTSIVLACAALALFLFRIQEPATFYFDEPQYVLSARGLLSSGPNPNPEAPPMGKLLVAVGVKMFGDNPLGWRIMSAVFGTLTLLGIFLWTHILLDDYALALTAALLTLLNNFLFAMSRIAMMDIFLVAFSILGMLAFTAALKLPGSAAMRRSVLLMAGIMFGFACACKWNGVDTLGIVVAVAALLWLARRSRNAEVIRCRQNLGEIGLLWLVFGLLIAPAIAYCASYWPLCLSLHIPFSVRNLITMNWFIWAWHRAVAGNPALLLPWYRWPLQVEPQRALSYLVGNWFVMWGGLAAVIFCARRLLVSLPETLVVLLYAGNLLQWAVTPQTFTYYYYYFPAAIFLGVALAVALSRLPERVYGVRISALVVLASLYIFLFCYGQMAHLQTPFDSLLGHWT